MPTLPPPRFYDPECSTTVSHRQLPHWEQKGVCTFVTFRMADSIPESVQHEHQNRKHRWLSAHGYGEDLPPAMVSDILLTEHRRAWFRMTSSLHHRALDKGHGSCRLADPDCRAVLEEVFANRRNIDYTLYALVIMPNHVHALVQSLGETPLQSSLSAIRRISAREINRMNNVRGEFWQSEGFDHLLRSNHYFQRYRTYIRLNPRRAHLPRHAYTLMDMDNV